MGNLHIFDMDGTLFTGTSANLEIARRIGTLAELQALENRLLAGDLDTRGFSVAIHTLWRELTPPVVAAAFTGAPWLRGIREVCADIRRRGEHSVVITMSPDFFAQALLELGFDEVVASRFPSLPFREPLDPAGILTPADKVRVTEDRRTRYKLPRSHCVAYGDSLSDAPLFGHLDNTVAVNADHHLTGLAARVYDGDDLTAAYRLARGLLTGSATATDGSGPTA
jgi:phosphoserine phosphatase